MDTIRFAVLRAWEGLTDVSKPYTAERYAAFLAVFGFTETEAWEAEKRSGHTLPSRVIPCGAVFPQEGGEWYWDLGQVSTDPFDSAYYYREPGWVRR